MFQVMRSLFFKMVSDPKCYNPRVLKSLSRQVPVSGRNSENSVPSNASSMDEDADEETVDQNPPKNQHDGKEIKLKNEKNVNEAGEYRYTSINSDVDGFRKGVHFQEGTPNMAGQTLEKEAPLYHSSVVPEEDVDDPEKTDDRCFGYSNKNGKEKRRLLSRCKTHDIDDLDERVLGLLLGESLSKEDAKIILERTPPCGAGI